MSYSRWGSSNWYAFWRNNDATDLESQSLALWHCCKGEHLAWSYAELMEANECWLKEKYPDISDNDISEALDIIQVFQREMRSLYKHSKQARAAEGVKSN
ncbi:unnamed protein product [marine sediment metagenome]|uniref:Uncharacterized protein n=1 Tax=marine sediment metagenome TaxID=412755 RepID=X0SPA0_9ZZZZ